MQYIPFSNFKYTDLGNFSVPGVEFYNVGNLKDEEIQQFIKENNIGTPDNSKIVWIEMCVVKERETEINQTEKLYLKNITDKGNGYFRNEMVRQSVHSSNFTSVQKRTIDPYLRNSRIYGPMILRDIISDTNKSLKISEKYEYASDGENRRIAAGGASCETLGYNERKTGESDIPEGNVRNSDERLMLLTVWDMYSHVTFETYNFIKNEWEPGELYIPEGTVYMTVEYETID